MKYARDLGPLRQVEDAPGRAFHENAIHDRNRLPIVERAALDERIQNGTKPGLLVLRRSFQCTNDCPPAQQLRLASGHKATMELHKIDLIGQVDEGSERRTLRGTSQARFEVSFEFGAGRCRGRQQRWFPDSAESPT
jgi:hypothetical protein